MMSQVPVTLLIWASLNWFMSRFRSTQDRSLQCLLLGISLVFGMIPVGGLNAGRWLASFVSGMSIPLLAFMIHRIQHRAGGSRILKGSAIQQLFVFEAISGIVLYPSALGLGMFDVYELGWGFSGLTVAVVAMSIWAIWVGSGFGLVLITALLSWELGLMESQNLWDSLVDPLMFILSMVILITQAVKKRRRSGGETVHSSGVGAGITHVERGG